MSLSVQHVINEARSLVLKLKEQDLKTDKLISSAQVLNNSVDAMKEYHEHVCVLSSISHQKPRSAIIYAIQKESKQLKQLENENTELKCALQDHHITLELIMSKYRQQISDLIRIKEEEKRCFAVVNDNSKEILTQQANKINEMIAIMNKSIEMDENNSRNEALLISQLQVENKGLRELLKIAQSFGSTKEHDDNQDKPPVQDEQTQTD